MKKTLAETTVDIRRLLIQVAEEKNQSELFESVGLKKEYTPEIIELLKK